jgi:hypothetical protein
MVTIRYCNLLDLVLLDYAELNQKYVRIVGNGMTAMTTVAAIMITMTDGDDDEG